MLKFSTKLKLSSSSILFAMSSIDFIKAIEDVGESIDNEDSISLMENFKIMASNCGTCHKKFKN